MAEFASLTPEAIKLVQDLEGELKSQNTNAVVVAYAKYADLDEDTAKLIQELEAKANVVLVAYDK